MRMHAHTLLQLSHISSSFPSVCIFILLRMVRLISPGAKSTWLLTDSDASVAPEAPHLGNSLN